MILILSSAFTFLKFKRDSKWNKFADELLDWESSNILRRLKKVVRAWLRFAFWLRMQSKFTRYQSDLNLY